MWATLIAITADLMFLSSLLLLILELSFCFQETHSHYIIFVFCAQLFLFLEDEVIKIDFDASDCHVIATRKRLEIVESVS